MAKDKLDFIREEIAELKESGLFVHIRSIGSPADAWMVVDGKRVLNLCTNNYLGMANQPKLKEAAKKAIDKWGVGPAAVRTIAGTLELHLEFERRMAEWKGVEACMYVQGGHIANELTIPALVGQEDVIFSDRLNHASIIDGCRLSRATIIVYKHCDAEDARRQVKENIDKYRRGLLVTDGVFSMDGDIAPLDKLYEVAEEYGLLTYVDDAHGEGVLGKGGRGIVDHFNLHNRFDIEMGTLSKAFGVIGGSLSGKKIIVDYLHQRGRPFLFSSANTPADTAASLAALELIKESPELVDKLWENARYFKADMKNLGFDTGTSETPITPVMLGEAALAKEFSARLFDEGVFAMALGYPTVPRGKARIRVMISAMHSKDDLDFGLQAFQKVGKELGVI